MPTPRSTLPVLRLGRQTVEWYAPRSEGRPLYGRAEVDGDDATAISRAAEEAVRSTGEAPGPCELSLDTSLAPERLLTLPAVADRELTAILNRKAASLLGGGDDLSHTRFLALGSGESPDGEQPVGERRKSRRDWFLVALDAAFQRELGDALRAVGFRPRRMTSSALSLIAAAGLEFEGHDDPILSIGVEERHTTLHLVRGDRVLIADRIDGDLLMSTAVAAAVVQAARNCASSWRKRSRGEGLRGVVLHGLSPERGEMLAQTLGATLPGVEVRVGAHPEAGAADPRAGRFQVLACAPLRVSLNPDLTPPQPPRRRSVVLAGVAGLIVALGLGLGLSNRFSSLLSEVRGRKQAAEAELTRLQARERELEAAQAEVATLQAKSSRLAEMEASGLAVEDLLGEVAGAFAGRADILELRVTPRPGGEGWTLSATGEAQAEPLRLAAHLEAIRARLLESDAIEGVEIQLPDRLPEGARLSFQLYAEVYSG